MLEYLRIRNLALIEDMSLEFSGGINVLTGETGVGKSFIVKSLGFLLGEKLQANLVRKGADHAQVEALFIINDKEILIRRELAAESGRSRLYINDVLKSQDSLKELRHTLISHTSQHAQQQLLHPAFQAKMMDNVFSQPGLLAKRDTLLEKLQTLAKEKKQLSERVEKLAERRDLLEMQSEEIAKVSPREGEEEELEIIRAKVRAEEALQHNYSKARSILHGENEPGLLDMLTDLEKLLFQMSKTDTSMQQDLDAVSALRDQLSDLGMRMKHSSSELEDINMDKIEERLFALAQLKRKLKRSLPEILALQKEIEENLSFLDACSLDQAHLEKEITAIENELRKIVEQIKPIRHESATLFARKLENQLQDLGFSEHVKVIPDFPEFEIWPGIVDEKTKILWAPNPGQTPQALDKIASGGELSRFLLAWISLKSDSDDTTFIFDEVDAGIGGMTLNKVAEKIQSLSHKRQIILITHWPQLAARARKHFQIKKIINGENTFTICEPITGKNRQEELARMAGGIEGQAIFQGLQD